MRVKNPPVFEASNNNDTNKTKRASAKQAIRPFLIVSPGSEKKRTIVFGFPDRENSRLTEKRGILKKFARGTSGTIFSPTGENNDCFPPASKKKTIVLGFGRPVRRLFSEGDPKTIHFFRIPPPDKERPKHDLVPHHAETGFHCFGLLLHFNSLVHHSFCSSCFSRADCCVLLVVSSLLPPSNNQRWSLSRLSLSLPPRFLRCWRLCMDFNGFHFNVQNCFGNNLDFVMQRRMQFVKSSGESNKKCWHEEKTNQRCKNCFRV